MILSGTTIQGMEIITPFYGRTKHHNMTFGCGPAGYDVRVEFDSQGEIQHRKLVSGGFILASTIERFVMPDDVMGIVHDKSSWARRGVTVQNTVIEPGWEGYLTLEICNHSSVSVVIQRGAPIAQVVFHRIDQPVDNPYSGKYQNQSRGPIGTK